VTASWAATLIGAIAGIAVALDSLEVLAVRFAFADGGIYGYPVLRTGQRFLVTGPAARPLGRLLGYPGVLSLPILQLFCAAVLVLLPFQGPSEQRWLGAAACGLVLAARMLFYARNVLGQDGSDQMLLVVLSGALVAHLAGASGVATIAVVYVAGQLLLSYASAGIAKAVSPVWRSGRAIPGITSTIGYGLPRFSELIQRRRWLSLVLCWSVIVFECTAPLLVLGGRPGAVVLIAAGLSFHLGIAVVMGLNNFLWSFAAAYPAVMFVAERIGGFLY
jgi:hypothetical protein